MIRNDEYLAGSLSFQSPKGRRRLKPELVLPHLHDMNQQRQASYRRIAPAQSIGEQTQAETEAFIQTFLDASPTIEVVGSADDAIDVAHRAPQRLSIKERLRLFGGEIFIHSHPSQGTQVSVQVPLATED